MNEPTIQDPPIVPDAPATADASPVQTPFRLAGMDVRVSVTAAAA